MPRTLIAGNWKMNGHGPDSISLAAAVEEGERAGLDVLICPAYPFIAQAALAKRHSVQLGAQDCSPHMNGAHTGDVSASMLVDLGCDTVIIGHSERRQDHGEEDGLVEAKLKAANSQGLHVILCVGETLKQREEGKAESVVAQQLSHLENASYTAKNLTVAYEPVWAIGTGKTAGEDEIADMHGFIRKILQQALADGDEIAILYGGSVKPDNALSILSLDNVNGALVGGASLQADDFNAIIEAARKTKD